MAISDACARAGGRPPIAALAGSARALFVHAYEQRMSHGAYADLPFAHAANVLRWLDAGPARAIELAGRREVSKQAISLQIQQLEARGYIEVCDDPADQRAKRIVLTPRGCSALTAVRQTFAAIEAEWADRLGAERYEALYAALTDLTDGVRSGCVPA